MAEMTMQIICIKGASDVMVTASTPSPLYKGTYRFLLVFTSLRLRGNL